MIIDVMQVSADGREYVRQRLSTKEMKRLHELYGLQPMLQFKIRKPGEERFESTYYRLNPRGIIQYKNSAGYWCMDLCGVAGRLLKAELELLTLGKKHYVVFP